MTTNEYDAIIADIEYDKGGAGYTLNLWLSNGLVFEDYAPHRRNGSVVKLSSGIESDGPLWIAISALEAVALSVGI